MMRHIRYWCTRIRNDFLRLCLIGPGQRQIAEEIEFRLRRDPKLDLIMDEKQAEMDREDRRV